MREQVRIIGNSTALNDALQHISRLAPINRPVLIVGERGTGKELAAERLHFLSARWDGPFIKVNCAAIAEQLLESELFGHEPGAFTGATRTHHGRFERADGGTLLLDELATMSLRLQEKLLRLVEYGEFERLGGQTTLQVDVRLAAATNADLLALAAAGKFRADLLDRLSFDVVHLPPLRARPEDILELAQHFAVQLCSELGWKLFTGFSAHAQQQLLQHNWPGNIRELKNVVERSVFRWGEQAAPLLDICVNPFIAPFAAQQIDARADRPGATDLDNHYQLQGPSASGDTPLQEQVLQFERQLLLRGLARQHHHQGRAATDLGLSYDQLRGLMRKHQLHASTRTSSKA